MFQTIRYSLCWPIRDVVNSDRCTIAARLPLNDFSYMEYWDKRYQVEKEATEFDWYFGYVLILNLYDQCSNTIFVVQ